MTAVLKISNYPINKWNLNDTIFMTVNNDVYQGTLDKLPAPSTGRNFSTIAVQLHGLVLGETVFTSRTVWIDSPRFAGTRPFRVKRWRFIDATPGLARKHDATLRYGRSLPTAPQCSIAFETWSSLTPYARAGIKRAVDVGSRPPRQLAPPQQAPPVVVPELFYDMEQPPVEPQDEPPVEIEFEPPIEPPIEPPPVPPPQPIFILDDDDLHDMDVEAPVEVPLEALVEPPDEPPAEPPAEPDLMAQIDALQAGVDRLKKNMGLVIQQTPICPICIEENKTPTVFSTCGHAYCAWCAPGMAGRLCAICRKFHEGQPIRVFI